MRYFALIALAGSLAANAALAQSAFTTTPRERVVPFASDLYSPDARSASARNQIINQCNVIGVNPELYSARVRDNCAAMGVLQSTPTTNDQWRNGPQPE